VPLITGDKQHGYADPVSGRRRCGRGHGQGSYHPGLEKKIEKNGKKTWKKNPEAIIQVRRAVQS